MKIIKVLGTGCTKCSKVAEIIARVVADTGAEAEVIKETRPEELMRYKVMRTPAVMVDDALVHTGSIPSQKEIKAWLQ